MSKPTWRRDRRAWLDDTKICVACGHPRNRHGGNVGKGRFGSKVFCVAARSLGDRLVSGYQACGCKTFVVPVLSPQYCPQCHLISEDSEEGEKPRAIVNQVLWNNEIVVELECGHKWGCPQDLPKDVLYERKRRDLE